MDVAAYFHRIGYHGAAEPILQTLRGLHRSHLRSVPFENLDVLAGRPIALDEAALFDKIVTRRRGGFCYELNGLFAMLLRALGFDVDLLCARAVCADGSFGPPFDHLALAAHGEGTWLADVGFGAAFPEPLRMELDTEQAQEGAVHRLVERGEEWLYQLKEGDGAWADRYLFTQQPHRLEDFQAMCRFHQSSPESPFTRRRICSRATASGRVTVAGNRLIVSENGQRTEREFAEEELPELLEHYFGLTDNHKGTKAQRTE